MQELTTAIVPGAQMRRDPRENANLAQCLAVALWDPSFLDMMVRTAPVYGLFSGVAAHVELVWQSMLLLRNQYGIPRLADVRLAVNNAQVSEDARGKANHLLAWITGEDPANYTSETFVDVVRTYSTRNAEWNLRNALAQPQVEPEEVDRAYDLLKRARNIGMLPPSVNPFGMTEEERQAMLDDAVREPTGISWLDRYLAGGMAVGEMGLSIMPQGSGKTTEALMFAEACVKFRRHVCIFQFEQPMKGDIAIRVFTLGSGRKRSEFRVSRWSDLSPEVVAAIEKNREAWAEYFSYYEHWRDTANPMLGVQSLWDVVKRQQDAGKPPWIIGIDWWSLMARKLARSCPRNLRSDRDYREFEAECLHELAMGADNNLTRVWVWQQMAGAEAGKSKAGSMYGAKENKTIGEEFDIVTTSSRIDKETGMSERLLDKSRISGGTSFRLWYDAQHCKLREPDDGDLSTVYSNPEASPVAREKRAAAEDREEQGGPRKPSLDLGG